MKGNKETGLIALAIIIPFVAWMLAALFNPNGWASDGPMIVLYIPILLSQEYLLVSIGVILAFAFIAVRFGKMIFAWVLLTLMTIYAVFLFNLVIHADEDEFA